MHKCLMVLFCFWLHTGKNSVKQNPGHLLDLKDSLNLLSKSKMRNFLGAFSLTSTYTKDIPTRV